ncbi:MAG: T9SS type A sorting domain-containing protein [Bacteroidota bacterium]
MKKIYSLIAALAFAVTSINAQCTIDTTNTANFTPAPDNVPCAEIGVAYDETLLFYIPVSRVITIAGQSVTVNVDSVVLNTVTGLPAGLNWSANPAGPLYLPGQHGCGRTFGTTTAAAGNYPISFDGRVYVNGSLFGFSLDTSFTIDQIIEQEFGQTYSLDVIAPGSACPPVSGINDFNDKLNAALSLFPNPNNGIFELRLNAGNRVNGEVVVVDVTGRKVFAQPIDVMGLYNTTIDLSGFSKGLYTLQLRTAEGFASKSISIE